MSQNPTYTSVKEFSNILSTYTCGVIQIALTFAVKKTSVNVGAVSLQGLCERIIAEAVLPITEVLKNNALIKDHLNSSLSFAKHLRKMIMELATVEDNYEASFSNRKTRKILNFWESSAEMKMEVKGRVKAGFDLKKTFKIRIEEQNKHLSIFLPKPKILSTEVIPTVIKMEDGWFANVDKKLINDSNRILRERITDRAISSGILNKAERNATTILKGILGPIFSSQLGEYDISVHFLSNSKFRRIEKNEF